MDTLLSKSRIKTKILKSDPSLINSEVFIQGWVRTIRAQKTFAFLELNDGSQVSNIQVVLSDSMLHFASLIDSIQTGAAISVKGVLVKNPKENQPPEIQATEIKIIGPAPADYVLQKKRHSFEFLRTIAHLRPRTNTFGAVMRIRNALAFATHKFFQDQGFLYVHTPIITASDCEGAGELFTVTTLDLNNLPRDEQNHVNFKEDFFGKHAYLTVSGQLGGEAYATALGDIYTFGPTFRAENSNTSRHLAEFWMIEPEMAFAELSDNMDLAESFVRYLVHQVLENNQEDLLFFNQYIENGLIDRLRHVIERPCTKISYTEALEILKKAKVDFVFPVKWGLDLQSEHERYLTDTVFNSPVIVYNYPQEIKSFYMRRNDDGKTVAAMDLLVPKAGELIGGSQREERLDVLKDNLIKRNMDPSPYEWYFDLRRYGSCPHAGFGLGFERMIQYVTGMENIRDVIPFPRAPKLAEF